MSVSFTGRTVGADDLQILIRMIEALSQDTDVYIGTSPPADPEEGDVWYNPVEDRYYCYVKP
jgi:hypothetical protein